MSNQLDERIKRAGIIQKAGSLRIALDSGKIEPYQNISLSEGLVLGLMNQGVRKFVGIFGHGTTDVAEVLRVYQKEGLVEVYNVRNETEASHAAAQLRWQYGEYAAVFTSIGPGALQAFAGSLVPKSNGLGVYYIFGDETTHNEGPNMQQIAKREQDLFLKISSAMGGSYSLNTAEALFTALKWGYNTVFNPMREGPYFMLLPMNIQGKIMKGMNLNELPVPVRVPPSTPSDMEGCRIAVDYIKKYSRITVKAGGGSRNIDPKVLSHFMELSGAVYVHGPQVPGLLPEDHEGNMTVGGSKGSISGNYAMENCELLIVLGARGVCQWDSSGTAWKKTRQIININTIWEDALQYNRTLPLLGDCGELLNQMNTIMEKENQPPDSSKAEWIDSCRIKRKEWDAYRNKRFQNPVLPDKKWGKDLLTQPAALDQIISFADRKNAVKIFDAGDVQANGFQLVRDNVPFRTYTDTGSSYMGFAVSALLASAMAEDHEYSIAFTGDGSFLMNPQILLDAVQFDVHGMIVLLDNRRMAAISGLQQAQYGRDFATDDSVEVDYLRLASAFKGVATYDGGFTPEQVKQALESAYEYKGLSLVYIPVYSGDHELGGLGAFGNWNVGNWCDSVQQEKHKIGL
ncbi:thiamine pyrophosphate-dependent enzyme [Oceanispirochaeta sp. M1]|uniref:thiamine pyrophosphate-dependent enzyme n=1 Tax=Oceanispirochaeta sp. M1 TaxID=2283433 RepID=UPI000E08FFAA|nr:thiamine pyrophosphate-dependent enzyme [Oceanispirochaeta sp. M1]NPD73353.1 thiamine pyrophosphate-binding protein [Oceanispirochaeta sp. M1]RDG31011.1 thiamine pyrophosphate-binding protein [Oceanispirochaeta sp. M1]